MQEESNLVISNTLNFSKQNIKYLKSNHNLLIYQSHCEFQTYVKHSQVKQMPLQTLLQYLHVLAIPK